MSNFLADIGVGFGPGSIVAIAPRYPIAIGRNLRNLATNLLPPFTVPLGALIVIELLKNGIPVPGFLTTYIPGEGGVHNAILPPEAFVISIGGDTFDLRVNITTTDGQALEANLSATVGVE